MDYLKKQRETIEQLKPMLEANRRAIANGEPAPYREHELPTKDKTTWGPGPWQTENDRKEWHAHGLRCLIRRHLTLGHLLGYVAIPESHPLYGITDIYKRNIDLISHGGITYSGPGNEEICHTKRSEQSPLWWFGFDCCHCFDFWPAHITIMKAMDPTYQPLCSDVYRTEEYVTEICERLALQLKEEWPTHLDKRNCPS